MCKVLFDRAVADSFAAYVYSPPVKKVKVCDSNFIDCSAPATPTFVQKIKANQEALIDCLLLEQNCGFVSFEGEKLYFYGSQLHGCHLSELSIGDRMNFDIVFNPRTNKFLATSVRRVQEVKKNVGHFQMMQVSQTVPDAVCHQENEATGTVSEICGHTHGFIENDVFFHYSSLVGTHISELSVGTSLTFNTSLNGHQKVARNVRIAAVPELNKNLGHFQMMQTTSTQESAVSEATGKVSEICGHSHGFIENDVFFHYSSLVGTHISELSIGTSLSFNTSFNGRQKVAKNVRITAVPELKISATPELAAIKNILELEGAKMLRRLSKNLVVVNESNCDEEVASIMQSIKVGAFDTRKASLTPFSDANSRINSRRGSAIGFR